MTVFGKILVVLTLLLCLVVGGLCVFVYIAGINNAATRDKAIEMAKVERASADAAMDALSRELKEKGVLSQELNKIAGVNPADDPETKVRKLVAENRALTEANKSLLAEKDRAEKGEQLEKQKNGQNTSIVSTTQKLIDQKDIDLARSKQLLDEEVKKNLKLQADVIQANQDKTAAEIAKNALTDTNKALEERSQDMVKEIRRLQQQVLTAGTSSTGTGTPLTARNPPTLAIEGKIMDVGSGGDQIQISIGSDAGLALGHTLEVFRFSPKPLYLGYVRIIKVTPTAAVGQIIGKPVAPLQRGDNVASRIQGS